MGAWFRQVKQESADPDEGNREVDVTADVRARDEEARGAGWCGCGRV